MQLIERYLAEVRAHLPKGQREDILLELRDDLVEQVQARVDTADREPTTDDETAVLEPLGHPLKLASSYKSRRYLIGPALYPVYLQTLKTALVIVFAVILVATLAFGSIDSWGLVVKGLLNRFFEAGLWVVGLVTLVYLALESSGAGVGWYDNWQPADLRLDTAPLNYSDVITNLVSEAFFLLWWNDLILSGWTPDSGEEFAVSLTAIWQTLFWPLNLLVGAFFLVHVLAIIRGAWPRWMSGLELVLCAGLLGMIGLLVANRPLVDWPPGFFPAHWVERSLLMVLLGIAVATVWDGVLAYRRLR